MDGWMDGSGVDAVDGVVVVLGVGYNLWDGVITLTQYYHDRKWLLSCCCDWRYCWDCEDYEEVDEEDEDDDDVEEEDHTK